VSTFGGYEFLSAGRVNARCLLPRWAEPPGDLQAGHPLDAIAVVPALAVEGQVPHPREPSS
jgi:hypothetical protein